MSSISKHTLCQIEQHLTILCYKNLDSLRIGGFLFYQKTVHLIH